MSKAKLLVVDDDHLHLEYLRMYFEDDFDVLDIDTSRTKVPPRESPLARALRSWRADPDLRMALIDLRMPGENGDDSPEVGFGLIKALKDARPDSLLVAYTAVDEPGVERRAQECGASRYYLKSSGKQDVLYEELLAFARRTLGGAGPAVSTALLDRDAPVRKRVRKKAPPRTSYPLRAFTVPNDNWDYRFGICAAVSTATAGDAERQLRPEDWDTFDEARAQRTTILLHEERYTIVPADLGKGWKNPPLLECPAALRPARWRGAEGTWRRLVVWLPREGDSISWDSYLLDALALNAPQPWFPPHILLGKDFLVHYQFDLEEKYRKVPDDRDPKTNQPRPNPDIIRGWLVKN